MKKVVTVVVTYNRKELLNECIQAILAQSYPIYRIIVIDNHSTDGTNRLFGKSAKFDEPVFEYHYLKKNIGGAGGFHEGFKYALRLDADWLWIMDDDTIPCKDCLEMLIIGINSLISKKISFLASSVFGPNYEPMNVPEISHSVSKNGYPEWYLELKNSLVEIESATFVSLLINVDAVKKIGLPVKDFFIWWDDMEYTLRLTHFYGPGFLSGKSQVIHKRKKIQRLSIRHEDSLNRIHLYYYLVRNTLVTRTAYLGIWIGLVDLIKWGGYSILLLFIPKVKYRFNKFCVIQRSIIDYILRRYDYKGFKKRFYM